MNLILQLNRLGKEINNQFPDINRGGCCVFASIIIRALKKQNINAVGFVCSFDAYADIDTARANISENTVKEWNSQCIEFYHVGVEFEYNCRLRHYDSNGVVVANERTFDKYQIYKGRLTQNEVDLLASRKDGWNPSFNRNNIAKIRALVDTFIQD